MYGKNDVLRLAKRYNNPKRAYLLVNPLQAKHLAVSPTKAVAMMSELGRKLYEKYPDTKLVIGFAETATAIGAAAAREIPNSFYIHTTRENINADNRLYFSEEHSHASEQKICADRLSEYAEQSGTVILIDDEISTGKTLINIAERLRTISGFNGKRLVAASIISRVSDENLARLEAAGIISECLVKLPEEDYTSEVERFEVSPAEAVSAENIKPVKALSAELPDPRVGVNTEEYFVICESISERLCDSLSDILKGGKILVLGTEECMLPSLLLGKALEADGKYTEVLCHSTTRSPIGICKAEDYPVFEGFKIRSFYENGRETYIYNLGKYDGAVIFTDGENTEAFSDIAKLLNERGCQTVALVGREQR